jgi:hypothetical protein
MKKLLLLALIVALGIIAARQLRNTSAEESVQASG